MGGDEWGTPTGLWAKLHQVYGFTLDAAANETNAKCGKWYGSGGIEEDALAMEWPTNERIWCNPPYSRGMQRAFVEKALDCARRGGFVVMLLPADTSTKLFHHIWRHDLCRVSFLKGRVRFEGAPAAAKFGSMLVEFRQ